MSNDLFEIIRTTRSMRRLKPDPVPPALIRQILVKGEAEVEDWRRALAEVVGPNGQLIINLIPEVEFVIGKQAPVAELPPRDEGARRRRNLVRGLRQSVSDFRPFRRRQRANPHSLL